MTALLTTPPAQEPVTLDEARAHLRVTASDEDTAIARLVATARAHVERATGRALLTQGWRLYLDAWPPGRVVRLPVAPVRSIEAVTVYDGDGVPETLSASALTLDGAGTPPRLKVALGATPPGQGLNGIEIDFTAGYGASATDVPAPLVQAILMLVAHWFDHRDLGADMATAQVPGGLEALIAPYRSLRL